MSENVAMTEGEEQALKIIHRDLLTAESRIYEHVASTFRWLMATLFAANGGAILAILNSPQTCTAPPRRALEFFAFGLTMSILMGILSTISGLHLGARYAKIRAKVAISLVNRVTDQEIVPNLDSMKRSWKTWIPSLVGVISFLSLLAGIFAWAGIQL